MRYAVEPVELHSAAGSLGEAAESLTLARNSLAGVLWQVGAWCLPSSAALLRDVVEQLDLAAAGAGSSALAGAGMLARAAENYQIADTPVAR